MTKARKELNRTGGKAAKPAKPRTRKQSIITQAEARRRAERHVLRRMFRGATVRDGAAVRLGIYHQGNWTNQEAWVVYPNPPAHNTELRSSQIIAVCKRTGRLLYEGPVQDEG